MHHLQERPRETVGRFAFEEHDPTAGVVPDGSTEVSAGRMRCCYGGALAFTTFKLVREQDMGRLSGRGLPPRLGREPSRFGTAPKSEADRSRQRDATQAWRAWYKTSKWQKLRRIILKRDGYICQKTGVALVGKYPAPNSPVVDHKVPHRGDPDLFWDQDNLQAVSKAYHDTTKQSLEKRGLA